MKQSRTFETYILIEGSVKIEHSVHISHITHIPTAYID